MIYLPLRKALAKILVSVIHKNLISTLTKLHATVQKPAQSDSTIPVEPFSSVGITKIFNSVEYRKKEYFKIAWADPEIGI